MDWFSLAAGDGCPFDRPRVEPNDYWDTVAPLTVSTLCLLKNQFYRGHCILIYDLKHVCRPDQLTTDEWIGFARDVRVAVSVLVTVFRPAHINVECLGNEIPHLHWHLIPRYQDDARWGGPVWTTTREEMGKSELSAQSRAHALGAIRAGFAVVSGSVRA